MNEWKSYDLDINRREFNKSAVFFCLFLFLQRCKDYARPPFYFWVIAWQKPETRALPKAALTDVT